MHKMLVFLLVITPLFAFSQKKIDLRKKYFGKYKGTVPSYNIDAGEEIIRVSESMIYINIAKDEISVAVGNNKLYGTYKVMFEAKTYYLLDAKIDGQLATERIMVYKRGRKIARDGMYPQPVTELKKYRSR